MPSPVCVSVAANMVGLGRFQRVHRDDVVTAWVL